MKVVLSTIGKFHTFDLARELQAHGVLGAVFSGYPEFKLRNEHIPRASLYTFPWIHAPYMELRYNRFLRFRFNRQWKNLEYFDRTVFDRFVSVRMPVCDVFVGLSGSALNSGTVAQSRGAKYVCDRGSSHIRVQNQLLREEHERWNLKFEAIDPRIIDLEEREYAQADCITIPSTFCTKSFISQGISPTKLERVPYGVNLERFHSTSTPNNRQFDILFVGGVSLRKGVQYLLEAYARLEHPKKSLTLAGGVDLRFVELMRQHSLWPEGVQVLGHVPQPRLRELMSRCHAMVLPSIEDGFGMVLAQAMACGCPVIGTEHTGAEDLYTDGKEGFIVPIRRADEIAERLQRLADSPALRSSMSDAAITRVKQLGGWRTYGDRALEVYNLLLT